MSEPRTSDREYSVPRSTKSVEQRLANVVTRMERRQLSGEHGLRRAVAAINAGTANCDDFLFVYADKLPIVEEIIARRADRIAAVRRSGFEVIHCHLPADTASAIASYPPDVDPPERLLQAMLEDLDPQNGVSAARWRGHRQPLMANIFLEWVHTRIVYAALGSPNGLPLRHKIATGALQFEEFRMMVCCGIVTDGPYQNDITVRRIPKALSAEVVALLREM